VSAQGFSTDMANSLLWDDKMESPPPWSFEKAEVCLWNTDMKDPSCTWDLDLSHQLAAKLLMIDDQPSQVLDQQMFAQNSFTYAMDMSMANTTARCVMTKGNLKNSFPEETSVVDLPSPLSISKALANPSKPTKDDLKVEIIGTFASAGLSLVISCPTDSHMPHSVTITMVNWFTIAAVTEFSVKRVETIKPVTELRLGEPPPRTDYW